jgi:hypothetical protein
MSLYSRTSRVHFLTIPVQEKKNYEFEIFTRCGLMNKKAMNAVTGRFCVCMSLRGSVSDGIEVPTNHSWYDVVRRSMAPLFVASRPKEGI